MKKPPRIQGDGGGRSASGSDGGQRPSPGGQSAGQKPQARPGSDSTANTSTTRAVSPTRSSTAPRGLWVSRVFMASFITSSMLVAELFSQEPGSVKNFLRTNANKCGTSISERKSSRKSSDFRRPVQPTEIIRNARSWSISHNSSRAALPLGPPNPGSSCKSLRASDCASAIRLACRS